MNGFVSGAEGVAYFYKAFYSTTTLQKVSFELLPGEVHALIEENGGGKSPWGKCITGIYKSDEGDSCITREGRCTLDNPKDALNDRIAIVLLRSFIQYHRILSNG